MTQILEANILSENFKDPREWAEFGLDYSELLEETVRDGFEDIVNYVTRSRI